MCDVDGIAAPGLESFALSDVAHVEMGQSPDSRYVVEDPFQGHPFLQGNAEFGAVFPEPKFGCLRPAKLCKANDILISVRAPVGAVNLADRDYCIGRGLAAIRVQGIKPSLLGEVIARQSSALRRVAQGTTFEAINKNDLLSLTLTLPPKGECLQIAHILDTLDTAIHETEAIIAKLKAVKQGLLHDLLTRGIAANGELRPPQAEAPHLYKPSPLGWIPKEWSVRRLEECAEIAGGVTLGRTLTGHGLIELPYLRVANVQDGYVDLNDVKTVRVLRSEVERFALADGDVLMNEGGDYDKLGRGTVWRAQIVPCLHQNHVFRVRCNRDVLVPDYLAAYSASPRGKAFFVLSSKQSTNLASINSTQLKGFPLACPGSVEQEQIVERLDLADSQVLSEERELQKLHVLKAGLMDDLLTGRVRVTPLLEAAAT